MSYTRDNKSSFKTKTNNKMNAQEQQKKDQEIFFTDYAFKAAFELMKFNGAKVENEDAFLKVVAKFKKAVTPKETLIKGL